VEPSRRRSANAGDSSLPPVEPERYSAGDVASNRFVMVTSARQKVRGYHSMASDA
jgi:hypothetical protein